MFIKNNKKEKFAIKKLTVGVGSVLTSCFMYTGVAEATDGSGLTTPSEVTLPAIQPGGPIIQIPGGETEVAQPKEEVVIPRETEVAQPKEEVVIPRETEVAQPKEEVVIPRETEVAQPKEVAISGSYVPILPPGYPQQVAPVPYAPLTPLPYISGLVPRNPNGDTPLTPVNPNNVREGYNPPPFNTNNPAENTPIPYVVSRPVVAVNYVDENGTSLVPGKLFRGNAGEYYTDTAPVVPGYLLVSPNTENSIIIGEYDTAVTYVYKPIGKYIVEIPGQLPTEIPYVNHPTDPTGVDPNDKPTIPYVPGYTPIDLGGYPLYPVDGGYIPPVPVDPGKNTFITYDYNSLTRVALTYVKDIKNLTQIEKEKVLAEVRKVNVFPEGTKVEVQTDGRVIIEYPNGVVHKYAGEAVVRGIVTSNGEGVFLPAKPELELPLVEKVEPKEEPITNEEVFVRTSDESPGGVTAGISVSYNNIAVELFGNRLRVGDLGNLIYSNPTITNTKTKQRRRVSTLGSYIRQRYDILRNNARLYNEYINLAKQLGDGTFRYSADANKAANAYNSSLNQNVELSRYIIEFDIEIKDGKIVNVSVPVVIELEGSARGTENNQTRVENKQNTSNATQALTGLSQGNLSSIVGTYTASNGKIYQIKGEGQIVIGGEILYLSSPKLTQSIKTGEDLVRFLILTNPNNIGYAEEFLDIFADRIEHNGQTSTIAVLTRVVDEVKTRNNVKPQTNSSDKQEKGSLNTSVKKLPKTSASSEDTNLPVGLVAVLATAGLLASRRKNN